MKKIVFLLSLFLILAYSCTKDTNITTGNDLNGNSNNLISKEIKNSQLNMRKEFVSNEKIQRHALNQFDELKNVISETLFRTIRDKKEFKSFLVDLLLNKRDGFKNELLYSDFKSLTFKEEKVENLLLTSLTSGENDLRDVLDNACNILPNLVLAIPMWTDVIFENMGRSQLSYSLVPAFQFDTRSDWEMEAYTFHSNDSITTSIISNGFKINDVPIQIKESERSFALDFSTNMTFHGDSLTERILDFKDCPELINNLNDFVLTKDCSEKYSFIDIISLRDFLYENCSYQSPPNPPNPPVLPPCNPDYERDCVKEKNVIEGLQFASSSVIKKVLNQPGGEDLIDLRYDISYTSMCNPIWESGDCPPVTTHVGFTGELIDFIQNIRFHIGLPGPLDNDVIFVHDAPWWNIFDGDFFLTAIPKYFDLPLSENGIYSQMAYLRYTENSTWNGDVYGSAIKMGIYEHDAITATETHKESFTVKAGVSLGLLPTANGGTNNGQGTEGGNSGKFKYSAGISKTSSTTLVLKAEADVYLYDLVDNYWSINYTNSPLFGYGWNASTGDIYTHLAFYY